MLLLIFLARNRLKREITDIQLRAVSGKAGGDTGGNARSKVTADGGRADKHDLRLELVDHAGKSVGIRLGHVGLKCRIVDNDDSVSAVLGQLVCLLGNTASQKDSGHSRVQICCQILCLADQFKSDTADFVVHLLGKDKYTLIFF